MPTPAQPRSPLRISVENASRKPLLVLHGLPRLVIPLVTVAVLAVGVLAPVVIGWLALALVFAFVAWLTYLSWPVVPTSGRLLRIVMLVLIIVLAVARR